jgi:hypothetical protein
MDIFFLVLGVVVVACWVAVAAAAGKDNPTW